MFSIGSEGIDNWIFVTGVIRSGTTFTGKILSLPLEVDYIHEPFNTECGMSGMKRRYRYVRPSLDTSEMRRIHSLVEDVFAYNFTLQTTCYDGDPWYRNLAKQLVGSRGPFYLRLAKANPFHTTSVIKDPTGSMMANYLYQRFEVQPVVLIRHPVSLVASFRRLEWWPQSEKLLEQSALVSDHFDSPSVQPSASDYELPDHVIDACVHWNLVNRVLLKWAQKYDWNLVKHERLCENPHSTFKRLYNKMNLPWSDYVRIKIEEMTNSKSPKATNNNVQDFERNSEKIFKNRLYSVSKNKREEIYKITKDVALQVYPISSFFIK